MKKKRTIFSGRIAMPRKRKEENEKILGNVDREFIYIPSSKF
ncbi:hypothetical protein [Marinitoga sp. 1197]|nr:hypothetical protein [Marinitoga sp. 1197]